MGSKGFMFDLNELPEEEESDILRSSEEPVVPLQASDQLRVQNLNTVVEHENPKSEDPPATAKEIVPGLGKQAIHVDPSPLPLGQHPLSCFRPFVRVAKVVPSGDPRNNVNKEEFKNVMAKQDCSKGSSTGQVSTVDPASNLDSSTRSNMSIKASVMSPNPTAESSGKSSSLQNGDIKDQKVSEADDVSSNRKAVIEDGELGPCKPSESADNCPESMQLEGNQVFQRNHSVNNSDESNDIAKDAQDSQSVTQNVKDFDENSTGPPASVENSVKADTMKVHATVDNKLANFGKRGRNDQKDAMLGKKRNRQTMFLDIREAAKQAVPPKLPAPKKAMLPARGHKESAKTPVAQATSDSRLKDSKLSIPPDGSKGLSGQEFKGDMSFDGNVQPTGKKMQSLPDNNGEASSLSRNMWRQGEGDDKFIGSMQGNKPLTGGLKVASEEKVSNYVRPLPKKNNFRKQIPYSQDSSIERLHREATCDKLWKPPGETELQCIPGSFDSVQEYVSVFEPLLFEECRAQLNSTFEELCEGAGKDPHIPVNVKMVERRERGWYDIILLPVDRQARLGFKEGDVAVLSSPKPGLGVRARRMNGCNPSDTEVVSRTAGIVRRYIPIDVREQHGATLRFYIGESATQSNEESVIKKFQSKVMMTWYLTVLGSIATTQREYVALHAMQHLQPQMIKAILNPKPEFFPHYEEEAPAMPECFTQHFLQHLHRNFNAPQLSAIKWAAMHTASGSPSSANGSGKRQDLWPFTLVQGPPGTGKTHTVWGMLNVIHLVQYQRYYAALLKKLAPGSVKAEESSNESSQYNVGSLDDVLQKMDRNLARILPKLCPKPRMLVCAPSNAATDELLTRVLEKGFIDGEMKVYRPDVARVGVDTQTRASQAVSVERRSDNLLNMTKEDVLGWLSQLRNREQFLAQQVSSLQQELAAAAVARVQGSVGVDPEVLSARDQSRDTKLQQLAAVVEERDKVLVELSRLWIVESRLRGSSSLEDARSKLEASFANEAEIVFTTVSSSGRRLFNNLTHGFDMVVIDEAAQASEAAVLPPLSLGAARCVLIGDPQQLPATVISRAAHMLQYSRSLFERFQQGGCPTMLLSVQYRMHPQIRDFPSRYFYQGRLVDSDTVSSLPDEPYHSNPILRPYIFYDVSHGRESHKGNSVSYQNVTEAHFAAQLFEYLQGFVKSAGLNKVSVGVITPYKLQLKCLQQEFSSILGSDSDKVYINTVDAFQGQERDVIIMSCVRASSHGVGFVADIRRMNVALTRARRCLWVIGNAAALVQSEDWAALIADAKERGCFMTMNSPHVKSLLPPRPAIGHLGKFSGPPRLPRSFSHGNKIGPDASLDVKMIDASSIKDVTEKLPPPEHGAEPGAVGDVNENRPLEYPFAANRTSSFNFRSDKPSERLMPRNKGF